MGGFIATLSNILVMLLGLGPAPVGQVFWLVSGTFHQAENQRPHFVYFNNFSLLFCPSVTTVFQSPKRLKLA